MKPIYRQVRPSVTMGLDQRARALAADGKDIINLTAGQVDLPMPTAGKEAIRRALAADSRSARDSSRASSAIWRR